jgi:radical SAM superfamily enzyme YgiQ (UPF0313 family)
LPVLVGGSHARLTEAAILARHPGVFVVPGSGEDVVADVLDGVPFERIAGLAGGGHLQVERAPPDYNIRPFLHETTDYRPFFDVYAGAAAKMYPDKLAERLIAVRGVMGCPQPTPCKFCTVQRALAYDAEQRAEYLVDERRSILNRFGDHIYIFDCSDALPRQECLDAISRRTGGLPHTRLHSGAMVWDLVRPERFDAALRAGYNDFLVGLDGYARAHLAGMGKPADSIDMMYVLLERSRGTSARYFISGIVGWPGESERTLREASRTIGRLLEFDSVVEVAVNFLMPMAGSETHRELARQGIVDPLDDCPNLQAAFVQHVQRNCDVPLSRLRRFISDVVALDARVTHVWSVDEHQVSE